MSEEMKKEIGDLGRAAALEYKGQRGFASMSAEKKREIASKGGKAAHAQGTAHKWTAQEAAAAGRKGGMVSRRGGQKLTEAEKEERWKMEGIL
jgi:general stress protein YciG